MNIPSKEFVLLFLASLTCLSIQEASLNDVEAFYSNDLVSNSNDTSNLTETTTLMPEITSSGTDLNTGISTTVEPKETATTVGPKETPTTADSGTTTTKGSTMSTKQSDGSTMSTQQRDSSTMSTTPTMRPPEPYVIQTSTGPVRGISRQAENRRISIFLGIPYAEPPVGNLRLKDTVQKQNWNETLNATEYKPDCPQDRNIETSEDCLYLNIWTPRTADSSNTTTYPVFVWFHGGRFETGGSKNTLYNGETIVAHENAIVVTFNYRIGFLGFGFLKGNEFTGNYGIKDQRLLVSWVKTNIGNFGGNSGAITLMGIDAGAASIGYLLLDPTQNSLFNRVIMLGGSPLMPWSMTNDTDYIENNNDYFVRFQLQCSQTNDSDKRICLEKINVTTLIKAQKNFIRFFQGIEFPPIIDNNVVTGDPWDKILKGEIIKKDLIIGVTNNEGGYIAARNLESNKIEIQNFNGSLLLDQLTKAIEFYPRQGKNTKLTSVGQNFMKLHFSQHSDRNNGNNNFYIFQQAIGDWYLTCPAIRMAQAVEQVDPRVYMYYFTESDNPPDTRWTGGSHGEDANYVFGIPTGSGKFYTPQQKNLSETMLKHFVQFGLSGKAPSIWPALDNKDGQKMNYYEFNSNIKVQGAKTYGYRMNECHWWTNTLNYVNSLTEARNDSLTTTTTTAAPTTATTVNINTTVTVSSAPNMTTTTRSPPIGPGDLARQCAGVFNQDSIIIMSVLGALQVATLTALVIALIKLKSMSRIGSADIAME